MSDRPDIVEGVEEDSGPNIVRWLIIGFGVLGALIVISIVIAIIVAATGAEGGVATGFQVVRDFLIIILALQGVFVSIAMVVLIVQLSTLVNLLRNEIKPLIDEVKDTASAAKGTAQFVSKNVAEPVIKIAATTAGIRAFLGEVTGIRRNIGGRK
jgi:membrane protein implicated in regulation of membrane protease activity